MMPYSDAADWLLVVTFPEVKGAICGGNDEISLGHVEFEHLILLVGTSRYFISGPQFFSAKMGLIRTPLS